MAQEFRTSAEYASRLEPSGWSGLKHLVEAQDHTKLVLFLEGQSRVLEMMGRSAPLAAVLDELMRVLEQQVEGMACCVLLVSEDRRHLRHGAAPSLPERYWHAIDGGAIGPRAGSCGTAAFLRSPVIVTDIARDPLWTDYRDLALEVGLRACWSTPILSGHGDVLGTFAMYHHQPFAPSSMHLSLIDLATNLARIAIERELAERERERLWDAKRFADRYLMVLQATSAAVWEWDLGGSSGYWNDGLTALGYEAQGTERTLDWWTRHVHPEDVARVRRDIERALDSGGTHWEEECRFRRNDGTYAEVVAHGLIVRDEAGKALRIVGALQDITQRKHHEQEMEQMAERFRSATVAGAIGTWRLDVSTELIHADPSLNRLLGQGEEETVLRLREAMRGVHPEDRTRVVDAFQQSIATGLPFRSDHRVVLADGEIRWLRSRGRVLFDTQGRPGVVTGAVADITELKHAEQSMAILADASRLLAESLDFEQILSAVARMAVPSFADGAVIFVKDSPDEEPRLAVVHAANRELLGALRELQESGIPLMGARGRRVLEKGRGEVYSRWNADWLSAPEVHESVMALARRFHVTSTIHVPIVMGSLPIGVIVFGATETRVYNARDLAFAEELARRASNAMQNAQLFQTASAERARAEEAAALRERLIAIVGHDLRNPLSAISMAAQVLSRSVTGGPNEKLVSRIQSSASRMTRMIAQILDFARIRAGMSFEIEPKSADLHQICNTVVEELRLSWSDRPIELQVSGVGDAICDADRIAQVLSNLIGNALQHGTRGPISVTVSDAAPDAVAVEVHNFGPPILERAQATMFDAFRREATTGDRASKSIGLGLFIANEIVRAHGGSIGVRSPDRDGTTFRVVLPRATLRSSANAKRE